MKNKLKFNHILIVRYLQIAGYILVGNIYFYTSKIRWIKSAFSREPKNTIYNSVDYIKQIALVALLARAKDRRAALAVVSILPPEKSGIALFSLEAFIAADYPIDFYAPNLDITSYLDIYNRLKIENSRHRVFPLELLKYGISNIRYSTCVFVIGNSNHNLSVYHALIKWGRLVKNLVVHLHDPCLWSLVVAAYPGNDIENIMRTSYPEISLPDGLIGINEALDCGALGSRKLLNQQDLRGIIVNSGAARRLVERELPNVPIRTIFHPIFKKLYAGPQSAVRKPGSLRIGSFGVPHAEKCTDLVLAAFFEIRLIRPDAELILAGYGAPEYIRSHNIGYEQGVVASEPEDTDTLVETMATCDVAIQLRRRNLGESSGIMALLMSVGIPVVGFDIGAFQEYREAVRLIPRSSTIKEISSAIIEEIQNSSAHKSAMADIIEDRSPLRFCTAFKDAIADLARPDRN